MSDTSKPGSLSGDLSAAAAAKVEREFGAVGIDRSDLDPHGKAADHTLRPDPLGARDPIGRPDADPHAHSAAHGSAHEAAQGIGGSVRDAADDLASRAGDARDRASDLADDVRDRLDGAAEDARRWVSGVHKDHMRKIDDAVVRGTQRLEAGRTAVEQFVTENPILVGVVGVAAGLLLGALLPRTRQEDRNLGPYADEVRDQGLRYAREFTSRGREFVETALDPDNIQAAAQKAGVVPDQQPHQGEDRTAHRL